jgi:hypothetical protein
LSVEAITGMNTFLAGDIDESFNLLLYDVRKNRFEIQAADLALQSLYKGIIYYNPALPIEGKDVAILLEKTGCFSKYTLKDDIYKVTNSIDTKEFINRCHVNKP